MRPVPKLIFTPIFASVLGKKFNSRNTQCISAVKIFDFLELEEIRGFQSGIK